MLRRFLLLPLLLVTPAHAADLPLQPLAEPIVIAHRGASALRPEHTLAAYAKAIQDGADYIEPDLVITRDGVLVARHENEIGGTTDVADHPRFADRRTTRDVDGEQIEGWFAEDFTLAELRTLRARERLPALRSTAYDGEFAIPTFDEIIEFTAAEASARGRRIVLVPELKHPTYFRTRGLALERRVLDTLAAHPYTRRTPVILQSFEIGALRTLREQLGPLHGNVRLLQLFGAPDGHPADRATDASLPSYDQMLQPDGLRAIARYAEYIGPPSRLIVPLDANGHRTAPTALVTDAHAAGLRVMPYTYRPENQFLPPPDRTDADPRTLGTAGAIAEIHAALDAGVDGFFADDPASGLHAVSIHKRSTPAQAEASREPH